MTNHPLILSRDYFNPRYLHMPRNQREAGIEHLEWEDRLKPLRPLNLDIGYGVGAVFGVLLGAMVYF